MIRDMDLVRRILMQVEVKGHARGHVDLEIPGYQPEIIAQHVRLLHEAGLIDAIDLSTQHSFDYRPKRLTWAGHEFLDAARNDTVWSRTKEQVKEKVGSIPFELLKQLLLKTAASMFALS